MSGGRARGLVSLLFCHYHPVSPYSPDLPVWGPGDPAGESSAGESSGGESSAGELHRVVSLRVVSFTGW